MFFQIMQSAELGEHFSALPIDGKHSFLDIDSLEIKHVLNLWKKWAKRRLG